MYPRRFGSAKIDFSSSGVTSGAWTKVSATTALQNGPSKYATVYNSTGLVMKAGFSTDSGTTVTETKVIMPGGTDGIESFNAPQNSDVYLKADSAAVSTGELHIEFMA